jgi:hypothetical protein
VGALDDDLRAFECRAEGLRLKHVAVTEPGRVRVSAVVRDDGHLMAVGAERFGNRAPYDPPTAHDCNQVIISSICRAGLSDAP